MGNELYHYGVVGMKWGVRRYQNKDGTLTPRGKQRYNTDRKGAFDRQREKYIKISLEAGMSRSDAEKEASKQINIDKVLLAAAGVTLAAMAGYAGYKYYKYTRGINIPAGTALQRISPSAQLHDRFYASFGKHDNERYGGLLQDHILKNYNKNTHYKTVMEAVNDIKAPNRKEAISAFTEFVKNDKNAQHVVSPLTVQRIKNGSLTKKELSTVYDHFNRTLTLYNKGTNINGFYDILKSKGYNSLIDVNDLKYSGYMARSPLIIFDKSSIKVNDITQGTYNAEAVKRAISKLTTETRMDEVLSDSTVAGSAAAIGLFTASKYIRTDKNEEKSNGERK